MFEKPVPEGELYHLALCVYHTSFDYQTSEGSTLMFSPFGRTVLRCLSRLSGFRMSNASAPSA